MEFGHSEIFAMGKLDEMRILKPTKARVHHICSYCGEDISPGDVYFSEKLRDVFLHTLHEKKFCGGCYETYGNKLLSMKMPRRKKGLRTLDEYDTP